MNPVNNSLPGMNETPAQSISNSDKGDGKKPRSRRDISAEAAHVLKFLNSCSQYQADAVRVIVGFATGCKTEEISPADKLAVNQFLNHGMTKVNTPTIDAVMGFRLSRSEVLMKSIQPFCGQSEIMKRHLLPSCAPQPTPMP